MHLRNQHDILNYLGLAYTRIVTVFVGHSYEFRVSACNDFGVSKPLETEKETKIQPQYGKF